MKKYMFFFMLLTCCSTCLGQGYNCFVPGTRQYFISANGYLRGMRIDSARVAGADTVYYPFHTPRGGYFTDGFGGTGNVGNMDSTGGSWLGKKVVKQPGGVFLFDNLWGDTVIIKTHAHVGDSWLLYTDTSTVYFKATVTAIDTITLPGGLDSVKTITINVYDTSGILVNNPLNNAHILLSRNHGLLQVMDLYTLPYPNASNNTSLSLSTHYDYYMDIAPKGLYRSISLPDKTVMDVYKWNIGDLYEYDVKGMNNNVIPDYAADTIIGKTVYPDYISYTISQATATFNWINYGFTYNFIITKNASSLTVGNSYIIDTSIMPEEYGNASLLYYYPDDTSYCSKSPLYNSVKNYLEGIVIHSRIANWNYYKDGLGQVDVGFIDYGNQNYNMRKNLVYYNQAGNTCGQVIGQLGIAPLSKMNTAVYPNPVSDKLTIQLPGNGTYAITVINLLGQVVYRNSVNTSFSISVAPFPNGVYNALIRDGSGNSIKEKIVVEH